MKTMYLFMVLFFMTIFSCEEEGESAYDAGGNDAASSPSCILHVDYTAAPGGDGLSWTTAYDTLEAAFENIESMALNDETCEIWCRDTEDSDERIDEFMSSRSLPSNIKVFSGFSGGETDRYDSTTRVFSRRTSANHMRAFQKDGSGLTQEVPPVPTNDRQWSFPEIPSQLDIPEMTDRASTDWRSDGDNIVYTAGNVGIGMNNPASALTIWMSHDGDTENAGVNILSNNNSQELWINSNEVDSSSSLYLNYNTKQNVMLNYNGGKTAIGKTSPKSTLHIKGSESSGSAAGSGSLRVENTYNGDTSSMIMDGNEIDVYGAGNTLHLNKNSKGNVLIFPDSTTAKVGVGTWNPTHSLTVRGAVKAEEVILDAVGADFVFEEDYNLMDLNELSKYVEKNHHLPEIAPARKMQRDGVGMGELQIKLLQKIEELTLYTIHQEERLKSLEEENKKLQSLMKAN